MEKLEKGDLVTHKTNPRLLLIVIKTVNSNCDGDVVCRHLTAEGKIQDHLFHFEELEKINK